MNPGGSTALAVSVGCLLGRQHKLRAALMLGRSGGRSNGRAASAGSPGNRRGDHSSASGRGLVSKLGRAGKSAAIGVFARSAGRR
jgi:hypothetical protein